MLQINPQQTGVHYAASKRCQQESYELGSQKFQLAAAPEFISGSTCPICLPNASLTWDQPKCKKSLEKLQWTSVFWAFTPNPLTCESPFSVGWPSPNTGKPGTCRQLGRGSGVPTWNRKCVIIPPKKRIFGQNFGHWWNITQGEGKEKTK